MFEASVIIGRTRVETVETGSFSRTDPVTAEVITRAQACSPDLAGAAANAAAAASPDWAAKAPERRAEVLRKTAEVLGARAESLIEAAHAEVGANANWTRFSIQIAQQMLRHAATLTGRVGQQPFDVGASDKTYTQVVKLVGVVLSIAPWTAPVTLAVRAIAGPLALGNTVI